MLETMLDNPHKFVTVNHSKRAMRSLLMASANIINSRSIFSFVVEKKKKKKKRMVKTRVEGDLEKPRKPNYIAVFIFSLVLLRPMNRLFFSGISHIF